MMARGSAAEVVLLPVDDPGRLLGPPLRVGETRLVGHRANRDHRSDGQGQPLQATDYTTGIGGTVQFGLAPSRRLGNI